MTKKISLLLTTIVAVLLIVAAITPIKAVKAAPLGGDHGITVLHEDEADVPAEDTAASSQVGAKAIAAAIAVGLAAAAGAVGMGLAIAKSTEGISRQPEADGKIRTTLMLGLVFIETAIIYALVVAILIIFVM